MAKIVISYRRADSEAIAGRIRDRLVNEFGTDSVFMDIDSIPIGVDFRAYIADALKNTDILLVVIGQQWLGNAKRKLRIHRLSDPVRVELETAFEARIPVWPILVNDAVMPSADKLPDTLQQLSDCNAATVAAGRDFHVHMERLIRQMRPLLGASDPPGVQPRTIGQAPLTPRAKLNRLPSKKTLVAAAGLTALLLAAFIGWFPFRPRSSPQLEKRTTISPQTALASTLPCSEEGSLKSLGTKTPASISFVNRSAETKKIYWLDHNGSRVPYATLAPQQMVAFATFITHPWVVTNSADACETIYLPSSSPQQISIDK
jgi:hypothetical protein